MTGEYSLVTYIRFNLEQVEKLINKVNNWVICLECQGLGKKSRRLRKKVILRYERELYEFKQNDNEGTAPVRPKRHLDRCLNCNGAGLVNSDNLPFLDKNSDQHNYPNVAIIGAGIGGVALAVACLHRGIPFTLYERDSSFDTRSQGYGLTLQQASRAIEGLGIVSLQQGVISTRHVVHTTEGKVIADWGIRDLDPAKVIFQPKRTNVHIARQSLRLALLEQLGGDDVVKWGHQLVDYKECDDGDLDLTFHVKGEEEQSIKGVKAQLLVGADGIRSSVRKLLMTEEVNPLRYLDCIVILGICPLSAVNAAGSGVLLDNSLLDSATVFQTANGNERIYMMPYASDSVMWQLSFPMLEQDAKALSAKGPRSLKEEACRRCDWHDPIPQILAATLEAQVSGYPVYDRALLKPELLKQGRQVTLIGDAAHPMSPFKGQGANQALLDALALARGITTGCRALPDWKEAGIREHVLTEFELEMLNRSAVKVKDSAEAAQFLHSDVVLHEGNEPRGRVLLRKGES
jgi:2-polyprenyl-6-methoxyphenol hydroxylase-like FAD-dependent oxidoreductase